MSTEPLTPRMLNADKLLKYLKDFELYINGEKLVDAGELEMAINRCTFDISADAREMQLNVLSAGATLLNQENVRLCGIIQKLQEWRHSDEVQGGFNLLGSLMMMRHALAPPPVSKEFQDKYHPLLEALDKEFPVKKACKHWADDSDAVTALNEVMGHARKCAKCGEMFT